MTTSTSTTIPPLPSLTVDEKMRDQLVKEASERLNNNRKWTEPDGHTVALHLSDLLGCIRKAWFRRASIQKRLDSGLSPVPSLSPSLVIRFGRGYGFQDVLVGDVEEAVWNETYRLYASPDGGLQRPIEIKTSLSAPLVKKEKEAGLEPVDIINGRGMRDTYFVRAIEEWKLYMLGVMKLMGWNTYHLVVAHWTTEDLNAFKLEATQAEIDQAWEFLGHRLSLLRSEQVPDWRTRMRPSECADPKTGYECEFLNRCIEDGVLDATS